MRNVPKIDMLYEYKKEVFSFEEMLIEDLTFLRNFKIKFPSCFKTKYPLNDFVYLNCFVPKNFEQLLIILPGLGIGPPQGRFITNFAKKLAKSNIAISILILPFHEERTPEGLKSGEYFLSINSDRALNFFQQAVLDVERTVEFWQENFDIKNFSLMGVSLGSIVSIISMAKNKQIKNGILILSGANFSKMLWQGFLRLMVKKDCPYRECRENFKRLKEYKELRDFDDIQNIRFPKECMYYEPLVFSGLLRERRIIMFNALFDLVIPFSSTIQLWKALGKPKIYWFPTEHYSIFIFSPFISSKVKDFLIVE